MFEQMFCNWKLISRLTSHISLNGTIKKAIIQHNLSLAYTHLIPADHFFRRSRRRAFIVAGDH